MVTRMPIGSGQLNRASAQGLGNVEVGAKINFFGNDNGEKQGFGLLGYVMGQLGITLDREADRNSAEQDTVVPALQWLITPSLQVDGGVTLGIARAATDWNPYVGLSFRY